MATERSRGSPRPQFVSDRDDKRRLPRKTGKTRSADRILNRVKAATSWVTDAGALIAAASVVATAITGALAELGLPLPGAIVAAILFVLLACYVGRALHGETGRAQEREQRRIVEAAFDQVKVIEWILDALDELATDLGASFPSSRLAPSLTSTELMISALNGLHHDAAGGTPAVLLLMRERGVWQTKILIGALDYDRHREGETLGGRALKETARNNLISGVQPHYCALEWKVGDLTYGLVAVSGARFYKSDEAILAQVAYDQTAAALRAARSEPGPHAVDQEATP